MENAYLGIGSRKPILTPEILYKKSRLRLDPATNEVRLIPLSFPTAEGMSVNTDAACENRETLHRKGPVKNCSCGFYAYRYHHDAQNHNQGGEFVLRVVGSGKMFEYKKGYRYGHQRLEEIIISGCIDKDCTDSADRIGIRVSDGALYPVCYHHAATTEEQKITSFSELGTMASLSLPSAAPRITVRSTDPAVVPWEKGQRLPMRQSFRIKNFRESAMEGALMGVAFAATYAALTLVTKVGRQA